MSPRVDTKFLSNGALGNRDTGFVVINEFVTFFKAKQLPLFG